MAAQKEAVMRNVRNQIALANAQVLMNSSTERCFTKCVPSPSSSLSSYEQACLSKCMDRYMDAFNVVSRTYMSRISRDRLENQQAAAFH
ncbi:uncharacterized protein LACBIDRAFT_327047 [Laccaria bicolor S238N-H82]|uniref:Mitochondrial import inner membrane translocase subunit n=1 Tax=Laccaria bicolor (strain S238N-H82 / ATCC MYA-4686) TaxID=486041 RepID=B0DAI3_LACBS|nr:uncharacterized protein LACBIDRAFT_327047 [Laccaria bicolor S238N-H82]EDR08537.1 predicted protein [Laccaria bicolor S238N-H82]|eukprot:XP_001880762.1 predicted protein [Laccaria bicolor S238N-H82]